LLIINYSLLIANTVPQQLAIAQLSSGLERGRFMDKPVIVSRQPYPLPVKKGEKVFWCACGRSANQPYCDGSHKGTDITPMPYTAPRDKIVFFCGCKHSGKGPVCDGSHSELIDN